jgi:tetratricopeptide (TPR) repeat protein
MRAFGMVGFLLVGAAPTGVAAPLLYDEHWPFNKVPFTIAEKAMGPQDGSALAIVNNRPVRYQTEQYRGDVSILEDFFNGDILKIAEFRDPATNHRPAQLLLKKALAIAVSRYPEEPWDVAACHVNLGVLYYQQGKHLDAECHFRKARSVAQAVGGPSHMGLASIHDCLGLALRSQSKYEEAQAAYKQALAIKILRCGQNSRQVASGWMNLAMLYNDWGKPLEKEHAFRVAYRIMDHTAFIASRLTPGPRPVPTFMPAKTTLASELPNMVSYAWSVIAKAPPEVQVAARPGREASGGRLALRRPIHTRLEASGPAQRPF